MPATNQQCKILVVSKVAKGTAVERLPTLICCIKIEQRWSIAAYEPNPNHVSLPNPPGAQEAHWNRAGLGCLCCQGWPACRHASGEHSCKHQNSNFERNMQRNVHLNK
jgi:hypothetical protein